MLVSDQTLTDQNQFQKSLFENLATRSYRFTLGHLFHMHANTHGRFEVILHNRMTVLGEEMQKDYDARFLQAEVTMRRDNLRPGVGASKATHTRENSAPYEDKTRVVARTLNFNSAAEESSLPNSPAEAFSVPNSPPERCSTSASGNVKKTTTTSASFSPVVDLSKNRI
jgi:hypothetical protein